MQHFEPSRRPDGRWDYTCRTSDFVLPVGYCRAYEPPDPEVYRLFYGDAEGAERSAADEEAERPRLPHYHADGHETAEGARECYSNYVLDHHLRFRLFNEDVKRRCVVCDEWTQSSAAVPPLVREWPLCEAHNTRECVNALMARHPPSRTF